MLTLQRHALPLALSALLAFAGCATQPEVQKPAASKPTVAAETKPVAAAPAAHFFIVYHENGRIYPIADAANYLEFLHSGELIYTRTRIGAGPNGETIVFGIMKKEADDLSKPALAEQYYDRKLEPTGPFYGEIVRDGRFLVFGSWADFKDYLAHNEITYTFTEVGGGPKGETVIYALNKDTVKQGRPLALIEQFQQLRKKK